MTADVMRNPFGVMDIPDPFDTEVIAFAGMTALDGAPDDDNARNWIGAGEHTPSSTIEGPWGSRWNGAADPTIPGDAADKWKHGAGEVKIAHDIIYLTFDWNGGVRKGMIEARREGDDNRLKRDELRLNRIGIPKSAGF